MHVVSNASFGVEKGKITGIVGESGAGKSTVAYAIISALKSGGQKEGEVFLDGKNIAELNKEEQRKMRGNDIAVITQDPFSSLNPVLSVETHFEEMLQKKAKDFGEKRPRKEEMRKKICKALEEVELPAEESFLQRFPFQISGGQSQRVIIALGLLLSPKVLIADEPTTALDVFVQEQILNLMKNLVRAHDMAMILITHNMGVVYSVCDDIIVMKDSHVVEFAQPEELFTQPKEEYTRNLIKSLPPKDYTIDKLFSQRAWNTQREEDLIEQLDFEINKNLEEKNIESILECKDLSFQVDAHTPTVTKLKNFYLHTKQNLEKSSRRTGNNKPSDIAAKTANRFVWKDTLRLIEHASFSLKQGGSLGLIGESGSGKSTLAKIIVGLNTRPAGVFYKGTMLGPHEIRTDIQMIFQSPYSSLNPRKTLRTTWQEAIKIKQPNATKDYMQKQCNYLLDLLSLPADSLGKYPQAFSGGQLQRICIARVLILSPQLLVCDEPTSALDISVQAEILNLLKYLQKACNISMLFISHDLPVVRYMCDDIIVLKDGKILEVQDRESLFNKPQNSYTKELIDKIPSTPRLK